MSKRQKRQRLTEFVLARNAPKSGRVEIRDSESPLVFRITDNGSRSFCVRTYLGEDRATAKPIRITYDGGTDVENLSDARQWARRVVDQCRAGIDPRGEPDARAAALKRTREREERQRFSTVVAKYLDRRVRKEKNNRTADEIERFFEVYFLPQWRDRSVTDIGRADVNEVLDDIFDGEVEFEGKTFGGNVAADRALAQLRACFNWWETQDDEFRSPIVKGMARTSQSQRKRKRVLHDIELQAFWSCTADESTFNAVVRSLLLTAQRRDEVACMARREIAADLWTIPAERYKTGDTTGEPNIVPLIPKMLAIIEAQPRIGKGELVFTTTGDTPFSGFGKCKDRLDMDMLAKLIEIATQRGDAKAAENYARLRTLLTTAITSKNKAERDAARKELKKDWWILHDLRRTAKTLMSRAGVRPDVSERVLGHVIKGVEGVYDQHDYVEQKRDALERLSSQIERIIDPPTGNVVVLREAAE
jgi:Arm DNA-binding domain